MIFLRYLAKIIFKQKNYFEIGIKKINKAPDLNFILYKSSYENYNWYNDNLKNEDFTLLSSTLFINKIGKFQYIASKIKELYILQSEF